MTKEMVGGCCVCSDERGWQENPLVYCDGKNCSVAVHQACYGIVSVPAGPWYCEKCLSPPEKSAKVKCELCPMREGAVKHADNGGWAHVVCALYIPEVRFGNVTTMDPIILSGVPPDRFNRVCYICEERGFADKKVEGACMQCNKLGCKAAFHVTCAQQEGLLCEESGQMDNIKYCGYCSYHFKKLKKDASIKMVPPYRPVRSSTAIAAASLTAATAALVGNNIGSGGPTATNHHTVAAAAVRKFTGTSNSTPAMTAPAPFSPPKERVKVAATGDRVSPVAAPPPNVNGGVPASVVGQPPAPKYAKLVGADTHASNDVCVNSATVNHNGPLPSAGVSPPSSNDVQHLQRLCGSSSGGGGHYSTAPTAVPITRVPNQSYAQPLPPQQQNADSVSPVAAAAVTASTHQHGQGMGKAAAVVDPSVDASAGTLTVAPVVAACTPPINTTPTDSAVAATGSAAVAALTLHRRRANEVVVTPAGAKQPSSTSSVSLARKQRRSSAKNIANLISLVSPVVEDTVSSFQREKVQAANQQQLLLQQHAAPAIASQAPSANGAGHHVVSTATSQQRLMAPPVGAQDPGGGGGGGYNVIGLLGGGGGGLSTSTAFVSTTADIKHGRTADVQDTALYSGTGPATLKPTHRTLSTDSQSNAFPTSLEQLLERQWEQGSQFLMEQAQHFDIASLLSCLHQLKVENQRLEDHILNLISRRDHLLAVNARLSLLLGGAGSSATGSVGSAAPQQPPHHSPHSPRAAQTGLLVSSQACSSSAHDFQLESLVNANTALSRVAAAVVSNSVNPSASKSFQSVTNPSVVSTTLVSPPVPPAANRSAAVAAGGTFNNMVTPAAYAAALLGGAKPTAPNSAVGGGHRKTPDGAVGVGVNLNALNLAAAGAFQQLGGVGALAPAAAVSLHQQVSQAPPTAAPGAGQTATSFVVPQLHTAAAANQLAEHIVRSHTPILASQFALTQDPHHQQMLYQLMQQQAVVYNNALSSLIQPTTSPHHALAGGQVSLQQSVPAAHLMSAAGGGGFQQTASSVGGGANHGKA